MTKAHDPRVAAACAALGPYPWRGFTPEMLARRVLGATDRYGVTRLLATLPGAGEGPWGPVEPVEREDPRVDLLLELLASHRWTQLTLTGLCTRLVGVLDEWRERRQWLEIERTWSLDEGR